jgi:uncharacterized protein (DUF1330 family)
MSSGRVESRNEANCRKIAGESCGQRYSQRTTVTEFDSVEQAIAAHDSPAYREALRVLGNACERDVRIVRGLG